MKIARSIALTVLVVGLSVPALANWYIPKDAIEIPTFMAPPAPPSWTAAPVNNVQTAVPVKVEVAPPVVTPRGTWVERPQAPAVQNAYVKSAADLEVLNQKIVVGGFDPHNPLVEPIPEPSSIAGLSAGIVGLAFSLRRMRKRP